MHVTHLDDQIIATRSVLDFISPPRKPGSMSSARFEGSEATAAISASVMADVGTPTTPIRPSPNWTTSSIPASA
jgi:hypothetical protein